MLPILYLPTHLPLPLLMDCRASVPESEINRATAWLKFPARLYMLVLVQAITLQPQWLFPSLWKKINRRMRNKTARETRPWEVVVGKWVDPHSCGESATIIHRHPQDRNKLMVFYWPALHNEIENKREIHLLSGRQNGEGGQRQKDELSRGIQKCKDFHLAWECGFFIFLSRQMYATVKASWRCSQRVIEANPLH